MTNRIIRMQGGLRTNGRFDKKSLSGRPLVSVITVVRNGEQVLERTIQSVLAQAYKNVEYIIVDGGSTDRTVDIIKKYDDKIAYWVSESDTGISDAFNKGISASTGEFIGLLNADDLMSEDQIEQGVNALQNSPADFVFGDLLFHGSDGNILYRINGDPDYARTIRSKMPELCHPTLLARKSAYDRVGLFDTNYHYAMDYEWVLRLHMHGGKGIYEKKIVGHMGLGGASDRSFKKAYREVRDISVQYGKNRMTAELLYRYRLIKGAGRRFLEHSAPKGLFDRFRKMFNPRYSSVK